jgi:hypothetical protein
METATMNHKKYCVVCDSQITVIINTNKLLDTWLCPNHGEQDKAIINLKK